MRGRRCPRGPSGAHGYNIERPVGDAVGQHGHHLGLWLWRTHEETGSELTGAGPGAALGVGRGNRPLPSLVGI